jgi:hypothetical protein
LGKFHFRLIYFQFWEVVLDFQKLLDNNYNSTWYFRILIVLSLEKFKCYCNNRSLFFLPIFYPYKNPIPQVLYCTFSIFIPNWKANGPLCYDCGTKACKLKSFANIAPFQYETILWQNYSTNIPIIKYAFVL